MVLFQMWVLEHLYISDWMKYLRLDNYEANVETNCNVNLRGNIKQLFN